MPANGTVEERIVEMRIDNKQFEAGAKRTIGILEQLDKGLNALGENNAGNFEKIGNSLDVVSYRFSSMGVIGEQVLSNLTNKAMALVDQLARTSTELSIGQIQPGFNKYSEKTRSVQTIMAATSKDVGTIYDTIEDQMVGVNAQLEKLNWFTDETSYNFLDMVNNIGKFTSVGVSLEDSVTAMEGISTWAAISGATVTEAGRAMYNLSQAMGLGAIKLQDWKSIENANMATLEFKETALETAVTLGTLTKTEDGMYKTLAGHTFTTEGFREYMSDNWFSSDVLVQTLKVYGDFTDLLHEAQEAAGIETKEILKHIDAYTENKEAYLSSKDAIEELLPYLDELTSAEYDLGRRAFRAAQEAKTFDEAIDATKDAVSTTWMGIFETIFGGYLEARKFWTEVAESLYNIFALPISNLKDIVDQAFSDITEALPFKGLNDWLTQLGASVKEFDEAYIHLHGQEEYDALIEEFGSLDRALKLGAIDSDDFHNILTQLAKDATGLDFSKTGKEIEGLRKWLTDAGYSYEQFEAAFLKVSSKSNYYGLINMYGSLENAVKNGAITNEMFMDTLSAMAFPEATAEAAAGIGTVEEKIKELRQVAQDVLNGKYKNGQERRDLLTELGYDPDMIQYLADTLVTNPSADIATILASKYPEEFEKIAESAGVTKERVAEIIKLLKDSSELYEIISFNSDDYISGGEHFKQGLLNLGHVVEQLGEAFQDAFGMIFGDLGDSLYDALASFHAFTEELLLVREYADGTIDDSKLQDVTAAIAGILQIIRAIVTVFGAGFKIIGKIVGLGLRIVGFVLPYAANIIWMIADLISGIVDTFTGGGGLASIVGVFLTILQALASPLLFIVDGISKIFGFLAQSGLVQTFGMILFAVFGALLSPVLLVASGIGKIFDAMRNSALVAAVKKRFGEFGAKLKLFGDTVRIVVGRNGLKGLFNLLKAYAAEHPALEKIFNKVTAFFDTVKKPINTVSNSLSSFFTKMKNVVKSIAYGYANNGLAGAMENIHYWTERFLRKYPALDSALTKIGSFFRTIGSYARTAFTTLKSQFTQMQAAYGENGFAGIFDLFKEHVKALLAEHPALEKIFNSMSGFFASVKDTFSSFFASIAAKAPSLKEIGNSISSWWSGIKEAGIFQSILDGISKLFESLGSTISGIDFGEMESGFQAVGNFFSTLFEGLFGDPEVFKQNVKNFIKNLWEGFLAGLREIKFRDVFQAIKLTTIASLIAKIVGVITIFKDMAKIPEDIGDGLKDMFGKIGSAFSDLGANFRADRLLKLAVAFGIVAAALYVLATKVDSQKLTEVAAIMVVVMLILNRLVKNLNKQKIESINIKKFQLLSDLGSVLFGLGIMIAAIGFAVFRLAKIEDPWKLVGATATILAILAAIAFIARALVREFKPLKKPEKILAIGKTIRMIATAMLIIALAIRSLIIPIVLLTVAAAIFGPNVAKAIFYVLALFAIFGWFIDKLIKLISKNAPAADQMRAVGTTLIKIAAAMLIVSTAIVLLIVPIILLTVTAAIFGQNVAKAIIYVLALIAIFGWFIGKLIQDISKNASAADQMKAVGTTLVEIAKSMLIIAAAILLLAVPIVLLAAAFWILGPNVTKAIFAVLAIGLLLGGLMAGLLWIMTKSGSSPEQMNAVGTNLIKIAAAMLIVATAIMLLVAPLILIATAAALLPEGSLLAAVVTIGVVMLMISMILILTSKYGGGGKGFIAVGAGILLIAAAFLLLAPALIGLTAAAAGIVAFVTSLKELGATAGSLILIIVALGLFGVAAIALALAVGGLAIGIVVLAAGLILMALACTLVGNALPALVDGLIHVGEAAKENWVELLLGVGILIVLAVVIYLVVNAITNLVNKFAAGKKAIEGQVQDGKKKVEKSSGNFFSKIGARLLEGLGKLFTGLGNTLKKNLPLLLGLITFLAFTVALHLTSIIPDIVYLILNGIVTLINSLADAIFENATAINRAIGRLLASILYLFADAIAEIVSGIYKPAGDKVREWITGIVDSYNDNAEPIEIKQPMTVTPSIEDNMAEAQQMVENRGMSTDFNDFQLSDEAAAMAEAGEESGEEVGSSYAQSFTDSAVSKISSIFGGGGIPEGIKNALGKIDFSKFSLGDGKFDTNAIINELSAKGVDLSAFKGFNLDELGEMFNAFGSLQIGGGEGFDLTSMLGGEDFDLTSMLGGEDFDLTSMLDGEGSGLMSSAEALGEGVGDTVEESAEETLEEKQWKVAESLKDVIASALGAFQEDPETKQSLENSALFLIEAISENVRSNAYMVKDAMTYLGSVAEIAFRERLKINSPSKVFEKLAPYIPMAVGQSITDNADLAEDGIIVMASGMLAAMQEAMLKLGMLSDERFDIQPTITPVVDLSEVDNAAGSAWRLFSGIKAGLRGSISIGAESANNVSASVDQNRSNMALLGEVSRLSAKLDELGNRITNMQIVMDTGALVGATAGPMDTALGKINVRRGRGR